MNSASRYYVTLDVTDAKTGQHFSSQIPFIIRDTSLTKYQIGKELIVRYDPKHKKLVEIIGSAEN